MKYFRVSLVTVKILIFLFGNRNKDRTEALWKEAVKMKLEQFFKKWYLQSALTLFGMGERGKKLTSYLFFPCKFYKRKLVFNPFLRTGVKFQVRA